MLRSIFALSLAIHSFDAVTAISLERRDSAAVVALDVERNYVADPVGRDRRRKRSLTVSETLDNEETLYFANITLGTPAQSLRLTIDTGSSDLWCNTANSSYCSGSGDPCSASGTYNASDSSTYKYVSSEFNISYVSGTGAAGDYATDTLTIGGQTLSDFQFGIGYTSTSNVGVLGIGYALDEAIVNSYDGATYANLPQALLDNGLINSKAYSLWLNDLDANTGSILFGGVDSGKYTGTLETIPIQTIYDEYAEFLVVLTGVGFSNSTNSGSYSSDELPVAVVLDSGSSLTYLPDSLVEVIYDQLGVIYEDEEEAGYIPCSMQKEDYNITYTFSSPTITVSMSELVFDNTGLSFSDGTAACAFGIMPAGDSTAILGDTFLRSAYVVYDLTNNEISLAQTRFNSDETDILEITNSTSSAVPGATAVSNPVTTVATGQGAGWSEATDVATSSSKALANTMATMIPNHLALGAAGAGILLAL